MQSSRCQKLADAQLCHWASQQGAVARSKRPGLTTRTSPPKWLREATGEGQDGFSGKLNYFCAQDSIFAQVSRKPPDINSAELESGASAHIASNEPPSDPANISAARPSPIHTQPRPRKSAGLSFWHSDCSSTHYGVSTDLSETLMAIECPRCGFARSHKRSWIKSARLFKCRGCRTETPITYEDKLRLFERAAQKLQGA
jgi:hypothetical protein